MSPLEYLQGLDTKDYFGFNLLVGDLKQRQVAYMSNRGSSGPQVLPPGVYGVGPDLDHRLSSIFIEPFEMQPGTMYGTRSQTVIAVWRDGRVEQRERYVEGQGANNGQNQQQQPQQHATDDRTVGDDAWMWKEVNHSFNL
eukprot:gene9563-9726_t